MNIIKEFFSKLSSGDTPRWFRILCFIIFNIIYIISIPSLLIYGIYAVEEGLGRRIISLVLGAILLVYYIFAVFNVFKEGKLK